MQLPAAASCPPPPLPASHLQVRRLRRLLVHLLLQRGHLGGLLLQRHHLAVLGSQRLLRGACSSGTAHCR
jgi:hypothetical protein